MAVGITSTGELMVRVGPDAAKGALAKRQTRLFDPRVVFAGGPPPKG